MEKRKYWFKNKSYGIGWVPASWEGWSVTLVYVVFCFYVALQFELQQLPEQYVHRAVLLPILIGMVAYIAIVLRTGEPLIWGWQGKKVTMRLHDEPFDLMRAGKKWVEVRLNDPKRQRLEVGQKITFTSRTDSAAILKRKVKALKRYDTFAELFVDYPNEKTDIYRYYTRADEREYGAVAIELE